MKISWYYKGEKYCAAFTSGKAVTRTFEKCFFDR